MASTTTAAAGTGLVPALYSSDMCEFTPTDTVPGITDTDNDAGSGSGSGADDAEAALPLHNPNGDFTMAVAPIGSTPLWSSVHPQVHTHLVDTLVHMQQ